MNEKAIVEFINKNDNSKTELEIPINITANDLIIALNKAFNLEMDIENIFNCYLVAVIGIWHKKRHKNNF